MSCREETEQVREVKGLEQVEVLVEEVAAKAKEVDLG